MVCLRHGLRPHSFRGAIPAAPIHAQTHCPTMGSGPAGRLVGSLHRPQGRHGPIHGSARNGGLRSLPPRQACVGRGTSWGYSPFPDCSGSRTRPPCAGTATDSSQPPTPSPMSVDPAGRKPRSRSGYTTRNRPRARTAMPAHSPSSVIGPPYASTAAPLRPVPRTRPTGKAR